MIVDYRSHNTTSPETHNQWRKEQVGVLVDDIELKDREFVLAICQGRQPNSSAQSVLACFEAFDQLDEQLRA